MNIDGRKVALTRIELELLQALVERPGHILGREQLMRRTYPDHRVVSDHTINSHVKRLRAKLRDVGGGTDGQLENSDKIGVPQECGTAGTEPVDQYDQLRT